MPKEPTTIGEHLKKKRFQASLRQAQIAKILKVSCRIFSLWERDRVYPAWAFQPRIVSYLGYDPFTNPALGRPKGNETQFVAVLAPEAHVIIGEKIRQYRLKFKKNRKEFARELGVSTKTLWSVESNRRQPSRQLYNKLTALVGLSRQASDARSFGLI